MAELKKFKTQRSYLKRKLTLFTNLVNDANSVENYDEIRRRLDDMKDILTKFENIQIEIVVLEDDTPENQAYHNEFESTYYEIIEKAHKFLNEHDSPSERRESPIANTSNFNSNVRLPKIDLPSFSGAYDEWICFYDTFKSMVHSEEIYSNITKFHYLRSCLKNDAAAVIQSLEISDINYEIAWSLLIERYDNRRVIIQNHLKGLLEQQPITRESSINVRHILDNINKHTRALKTLGQPVETWDTILIYCMASKLDKYTHQEWEKSITSNQLPTLKEFLAFLTSRSQILEATELQSSRNQSTYSKNTVMPLKKSILNITHRVDFCHFCKAEHKIFKCEKFLKLNPFERLDAIKKVKACFNCLRKGHSIDRCTGGTCKRCGKKHHTLLHLDRQGTENVQRNTTCENVLNNSVESVNSVSNNNPNPNTHIQALSCGNSQHENSSQIVLATAKVVFFDVHNNKHIARVVLDSGAQAHFISENLANVLKLKRTKTDVPVVAINQMETTIRNKVNVKIASTNGHYENKLCFLVVPKVSAPLPTQQINSKRLNIPKNLFLADPTYYKSSEIDALIGAEVFYELLCAKQISINNESAVLQKTRFGWVIVGKITNDMPIIQTIYCNLSISSIHSDISRFWEIEEIPETKFLSTEEAQAEQHFLANTYRDETGRYVVKLPFNENSSRLGNTCDISRRQFFALERRFQENPQMKLKYVNSMREYLNLGHMTEIKDPGKHGNYMPHHAVVKLDSTTTQYRPVFNASVTPDENQFRNRGDNKSGTLEKVTLNQSLLTGPTIQNEIFDILVLFRMHRFVLIADIEKMYRQILLHPEDRKFQQIFWRENTNEPLKVYQLNTLTFGTACAPFLAIRTLHKLADDENSKYPLTGCDTVETSEKLRNALFYILYIILNSRPLTPFSTYPNDLIALTPAHFLINDSLITVPEVDFTNTSTNRLSNWEHLRKLKQHFWQRWHKEYWNELNNRRRWSSPHSNKLTVDEMVLLKEVEVASRTYRSDSSWR